MAEKLLSSMTALEKAAQQKQVASATGVQSYTGQQTAVKNPSINPNTPILDNAKSGQNMTSTASLVDSSKKYAGNPLTSNTPAATTPTMTAEQLAEQDRIAAEARVEQGMKDNNTVATQYGLTTSPDTIQGVVDQFKADQEQKKSYTLQELDRQRVLDEAANARFKEQAQGSISATNTSFAQGREGAMAGSAAGLKNEFTVAINKQINEADIRLKSAQAARDQAMIALDKAQKAGNDAMVESISKSLSAAKQQIRQEETNYLNALTNANEQARLASESTQTQNRQNITTFTGLVDGGATMSPQTIMQMSSSLGIPVDMAFGYYAGSESIRMDKSLTTEDKQLRVEDLKRDFSLKAQGYVTETAQQIKGISDMMASGQITSAQASDLFMGLGIDNSMNPITVTKNRAEELKLKVAEAQASGRPVTSGEINERARLLSDLSMLGQTLNSNGDIVEMGSSGAISNGEAYVPNAPVAGFEVSFEGGQLKVTAPYKNGGWQCGEGVNRTWGLNAGGSGGMGNTYESKTGLVDRNGLKSSEITDPDNQIKPGMAFVMGLPGTKYEWTGHTGLVKQNLGGGNFLTAEWNWDGKGGYSEQIRNTNQIYGLAYPPSGKAEFQSTSPNSITNMSNPEILSLYEKAGKTFDDPKAAAQAIATAKANNYIPGMNTKEAKTPPPEYSWAGTVLNNSFGDAEGGKAAARKNEELANAIENGDGKTARNIVFNAILKDNTSGERTAFNDALTLSDSYAKMQQAIDDFNAAGLETGLVGGTMSDIYKNLKQARPEEATALNKRLTESFNAYRTAVTGAGASVGELEMLKEGVATFDKPMAEIQVMTDISQKDASDSLDRQVETFSRGAFRSYKEMQDQLDSLETLGKGTEAQQRGEAIKSFAGGLLQSYFQDTGNYVVPEDHPITNLDL